MPSSPPSLNPDDAQEEGFSVLGAAMLQLVNPKEFARFKQLGVIASMQLLWATAESYTEELVKPYVSAAAYQYQYPARSLHQAGATIAGASDWPVSSPNPWHAIAQASTRKGLPEPA